MTWAYSLLYIYLYFIYILHTYNFGGRGFRFRSKSNNILPESAFHFPPRSFTGYIYIFFLVTFWSYNPSHPFELQVSVTDALPMGNSANERQPEHGGTPWSFGLIACQTWLPHTLLLKRSYLLPIGLNETDLTYEEALWFLAW